MSRCRSVVVGLPKRDILLDLLDVCCICVICSYALGGLFLYGTKSL